MKFRNLFPICILLIMTAACAPAASDSAQVQSADSAEATETVHGEEDVHSDENADEQGSEESEHSDDDMDKHEHDDEGENEHREHGAHEHGVAELTIAWSGSEMAIDLQTPAYNVLGFEYAPTTDEEKALLAESVAALEAGNLLQPNPDAECSLSSAEVRTALTEDAHVDEGHEEDDHGDNGAADEGNEDEGHEEDNHAEDHDAEVHSDIDVSYNLACQQPDNIESLDASALFERFPNFEDIEVQWVSETQQSAAELTPDNPVVSLK